MEDIIIFIGAIILVLIFVTVLNKLFGKKGHNSTSHYDSDDVLDRMHSNDHDYDFDNDRD